MFKKQNDEKKRQPNYIFMGLAAVYLIYLAYKLLKDNLFQKTAESSPIFIVFGVLFIGVAIYLFVTIAKLRKIQKAKEEEEYQKLLKEEEEEYMRVHSEEAYSDEDGEVLPAYSEEEAEEVSETDDEEDAADETADEEESDE